MKEIHVLDRGERPAKRPNIFLRLLALLVTLALALGAVALVAFRDQINLDAVRRYFVYRSLSRNDSGQAESFPYDGGISSQFVTVGQDLLIATGSSIRLYSGSGAVYVSKTVSMERPVARSAGKYGLCYDAGGQNLFLFGDRQEIFSLEQEEGRSIISANLTATGQLAVAAQESGHKGSVTVYNSAQEPTIKVSLSSGFIMDAALSPDGRTLAILTVAVGSHAFESRVLFYHTDHSSDDAVPDAVCSLGNSVILELSWTGTDLWALGENAVFSLAGDGTMTGQFSYGNRYLKAFTLAGDHYAAALLGRYRAGSAAQLSLISPDGTVQGVLDVGEQVLSLSSAGRYLAVLYADRLEIYADGLTPYHTLEGTHGARKALMRNDGSVLLIDNSDARLYLPG